MRWGWTLLFSMLMLACNLFKGTVKSSKASHSDSSAFRFYSDSSGYEQETLIWPKGSFNYSPGIGFFGEAEKVQFKAQGQRKRLSAEMSKVQASTEEKVLVKEATIGWKLWLLIGVVGIYLSFKFYKKWQF